MYKKKPLGPNSTFREILNYSFYGSHGEHRYRSFEYEMRGEEALVYRSGAKQGEHEVARLKYFPGKGISISRGSDIDTAGYREIKPEISRDVSLGMSKFNSSRERPRKTQKRVA